MFATMVSFNKPKNLPQKCLHICLHDISCSCKQLRTPLELLNISRDWINFLRLKTWMGYEQLISFWQESNACLHSVNCENTQRFIKFQREHRGAARCSTNMVPASTGLEALQLLENSQLIIHSPTSMHTNTDHILQLFHILQ